MWDIFEKLMNEENLSISEVARRIGCSPSSLTDWRAGRSAPKTDKLYQMAKLFGVSMEYLLTGVETPTNALSASERKLLRLFRKLNDIGQSAALERMSEIAELSKYTQEKTNSKVG